MSHLKHKHGGKITCITAIGHETHNRIVFWYYMGRVEWNDASISETIRIAPIAVCYDHDNQSACREYDVLSKKLTDYLIRNGRFTQRGKWVPHVKQFQESLS